MLFQESEIKEREENFYKNIIRLYLKYGSVDEVFKETNYDLPISYPGMHHLISRWGIVKSVGPNSKLSEALTFLTLLTENKIPLEALYKRMPPSFQTSLSTMHRIAHNAKEGVVRRHGTAVVITSAEDGSSVLVGHDVSHKKLTLPMTYSTPKEERRTSILRVLQQEVFSELAVEKYNLERLIPSDPLPFMNLTIADIKVGVYKLGVDPYFLSTHSFSSQKVNNHKFVPTQTVLEINKNEVRPGVKNIIEGYKKHLETGVCIPNQISNLNLALLQV